MTAKLVREQLVQTFYNSHSKYFFTRSGGRVHFIRYVSRGDLLPEGNLPQEEQFSYLSELMYDHIETFFRGYIKDQIVALFHDGKLTNSKLGVSKGGIILDPEGRSVCQEFYVVEQNGSKKEDPDKKWNPLFLIALYPVKPREDSHLPAKFHDKLGVSIDFFIYPKRNSSTIKQGLDDLLCSLFVHLCEENV
jgi:hypothetical protein